MQWIAPGSREGENLSRPAGRPWLTRYAKTYNDSKPGLPDPLVRSAREQLYLGHLWDVMLPREQQVAVGTARPGAQNWATLITQLYDKEPGLRHVVIATAMGCLASLGTGRQEMLAKALETYTQAAREIGKALQRQTAYKSDGLVVASALMASFDVSYRACGF